MMLNRPAIVRLFASICLIMVMACSAWAGNITPVISNSIMGSNDIVSDPLSPILMPDPIFVYQPDRSWISAHASGLKSTTYARTSAQTYVDADGVLRIAPANVPAIENGYVMLEGAATSYYWQPYTESGGAITAIEAPVTRTVTLPSTGNYVLWIDGNASLSVTVAANTAAGSGWGTLTESGSLKLSITTAGTVDVTVLNGAANDIVQLTKSAYKTSYIPTPTSTPVTRTTSASDTSGNGLSIPLSQGMIDSLAGELCPNYDFSGTYASGLAHDWTKTGSNLAVAEETVDTDGAAVVQKATLTSATDSGNLIAALPVLTLGATYEITIKCKLLSGTKPIRWTLSNLAQSNKINLVSSVSCNSSWTTSTFRVNSTYSDLSRIIIGGGYYESWSLLLGKVSCRRVLDSGQTNPGEGTLIQWVYLPYASSAITSSTTINVLTPNNAAASGIYITDNGSGARTFNLNDGTNTATVTAPATAGLYGIASKLNAATGKMIIGYITANSPAVNWGTEATYDGAFPIYSTDKNLRWFYGGTLPIGIGGCALYDTIMTDDEIIRAAQALQ